MPLSYQFYFSWSAMHNQLQTGFTAQLPASVRLKVVDDRTNIVKDLGLNEDDRNAGMPCYPSAFALSAPSLLDPIERLGSCACNVQTAPELRTTATLLGAAGRHHLDTVT